MPTLIELLEAGAHFGHKKERSHPKAKEFTFTLREGVYVIDLEKTLAGLEAALEFLKKQASLGKTILFVGTKKQAQDLTQKVAENTGMPYINHRWLGGTITNFETIRRNVTQLDTLEGKINSPEFESLTKKEKKVITDKIEKLMNVFGGVRLMKNLPDAIFVIDAAKEKLALEEGKIKEIPIVAICDTDANPEMVTYPIPANDDAPKTLDMIMKLVEIAVLEGEGMKSIPEEPKAEVKEEVKEETKVEEKAEVKTEPKVEEKKPARSVSSTADAGGEIKKTVKKIEKK